MKVSAWLVLLSLALLPMICMGAEFEPFVLVYDPGMPGFAEGVSEMLASSGVEDQFVVVTDPVMAAAMLGLPNLRCVMLTSASSSDLHLLAKPVLRYFESGGSAIGFYGSCSQSHLGDMARKVFPVFGNSTGAGTRKDGVSVVEYVRDEVLVGVGDSLPDRVDLVGQFFAVAKNSKQEIVFPEPEAGNQKVIFREQTTGAPLVIAYEGEGGGRSIAFTGLFVRDNPDASSYYGKLLDQEEFKSLLADSLAWCSEGNSRYNEYENNHDQLIEDRSSEEEGLIGRSERRESSRRNRWVLLLIVSWILGLSCVGTLVYFGFVRTREG